MEKYNGLIGLGIFVIFFVIIGFFVYHQNQPTLVTSSLVLTPSPAVSPSPTTPPQVDSWHTYTNSTYNFTIDAPTGWNQQEFTPATGNFIVAFSPNTLPCATCTYVHDGYFSVIVYTQQTDPQRYKAYTQNMQNAGKDKNIIPVTLEGIHGILVGNEISIPNHGYIYELSLDTNDGNDSALKSDIFKHAANTFHFTYLIFSQ